MKDKYYMTQTKFTTLMISHLRMQNLKMQSVSFEAIAKVLQSLYTLGLDPKYKDHFTWDRSFRIINQH